jgi:hypothetical protein
MNSGSNISTEEVYSDLGTPIDEYIGVSASSTVCMAAGLSFSKTRLNEIRNIAKANSQIIKKNKEDADGSLFDDDVDFLNEFEKGEEAKEKGKKKVSSFDILSEFL